MKKIVIITLIFFILASIGCGNNKVICLKDKSCHEFQQFGLIDSSDLRNHQIEYKIIWGNVFWSIVCFESIFIPAILIGWYLYEPIGLKVENSIPGTIK